MYLGKINHLSMLFHAQKWHLHLYKKIYQIKKFLSEIGFVGTEMVNNLTEPKN
jgi:hypothetical protein